MRSMLAPAWRARRRSRSTASPSPPGRKRSLAVQHAPRQYTGTPLTWTANPPSCARRTSRKPTAPQGSEAAWPSMRRAQGTSGCSPWVCGHHSGGRSRRSSALSRQPSGPGSTWAAAWCPAAHSHTRPGRPAQCSSARTATTPVSPSRRVVRCSSGTLTGPVSRRTARQGPTGASGGDQPGIRPSRVVRSQRSCCWLTRLVFQRGRGRFFFSSSFSERKPRTSSLRGRRCGRTSTR